MARQPPGGPAEGAWGQCALPLDRTSKQHLQDARIRRNKHGNRNVDPYETMWKESANGGRFFAQTFGAAPFAKPGRVISTRAKRCRGGNGNAQKQAPLTAVSAEATRQAALQHG